MPEKNKHSTSQTSSRRSRKIDATVINQLFERFSAIYGHLWNSLFKSTHNAKRMRDEWFTALQDYALPTLQAAVLISMQHKMTYPPTLPEFLQFCRQAESQQRTYKPPEPAPRANPALVEHQLQKIKAMLSTKKDKT